MSTFDYAAAVAHLRSVAAGHRELVENPYKHPTIKQSSAVICALLETIADAVEKGARHD